MTCRRRPLASKISPSRKSLGVIMSFFSLIGPSIVGYSPVDWPPLAASKRIVVLWVGRLGDVLVSTPFLDGLRRAAPKAHIVLVTAEAGEGGARLLDCVDEVAVVRKGRRVLRNAALLPVLARRTDYVIDMNSAPSSTSRALARIAIAKVKTGFQALNEPPGEREHMLDRYARLAKALGFEPAAEMRVPVSDEAEAKAGVLLGKMSKPVALFPGNFKKNENRWPEERFAELADRLAALPGFSPFWLTGPGEEADVRRTAALSKTALPVHGPFPLDVTAAVLEHSALYVGNCTGVSHLAAAVGTPSFMPLAGYTAAVWAPRTGPHWSAVSSDWESCRPVTVEQAWAAVQPALAAARSDSRL
ncbi:lipopolysaccharide heptosyltransferase family protein [bacterium]|nr:MAG: lipopolysaccharide heptosyltransferase family protein [bacterium]